MSLAISIFVVRRPSEMAAFAELALWPELVRAVEDLGWQLPTPVQAEAIPLILGVRSLTERLGRAS